jgi:hypothetical protein
MTRIALALGIALAACGEEEPPAPECTVECVDTGDGGRACTETCGDVTAWFVCTPYAPAPPSMPLPRPLP